MRLEEIIAEAEVRASVIFESRDFADSVKSMSESEKSYIVLDEITVTDGDENGTAGCSQVIYLGTDVDGFLDKMVQLAKKLGTKTILFIKPEETSQVGYCVEVKDKYLFDKREANFLPDLSCTFIDEFNISYEKAIVH